MGSDAFFRGKIVLITGSSKGIGKATALEFLKAGAKVVLNGRSPEPLEKTANAFREGGYEVLALAGDVSDNEFCQTLVKESIAHFGRIDILINNAGGGFRGLVEETSPQVFRQVVDSNLMSAVYCTQAALPEIKKNKGSIVFISSLSGIRGLPQNGPYCVAKMGLTALAETLHIELHGTGVHIGLLMVGFTDYDEDKVVTYADGSMKPISRGSHHTREQVARIILNSIRRRRFKVVFTLLGKLQAFFQRFSPRSVDWILIRSTKSSLYQ